MSLKDVLRQAHGMVDTAELPDSHPDKVLADYVKPRHDAWMARPEHERVRTPEALEFASKSLAGDFQHERSGRFSPSSLGSGCEREILFSYAGAPQLPFPKSNLEKMDAGTFDHLRWQTEGLSAGYMTAGEVWVFFHGMRMGGSADARLADGSLFELKNTGGHLYEAISRGQSFLDNAVAIARETGRGSAANYAAGMHHKHKLQMEAYWELDRLSAAEEGRERVFTDFGSLVYQDTYTKEIHEVRLHSQEARRTELHHIVGSLNEWVDVDDLPDMLEECWRASGGPGRAPGEPAPVASAKDLAVHARCAYRQHCPQASTVSV